MANNATIDDEISLRISRASASFGRVKDRVWCRDYISIMHRVFKMLYIYFRAAVSVAARCYACLTSIDPITGHQSTNRRKRRSFFMTMKIYFWFKMFLENINVSFIKTVINPLYDVNEYVLCKGLNIHLYLSYEINWKTQTNF